MTHNDKQIGCWNKERVSPLLSFVVREETLDLTLNVYVSKGGGESDFHQPFKQIRVKSHRFINGEGPELIVSTLILDGLSLFNNCLTYSIFT